MERHENDQNFKNGASSFSGKQPHGNPHQHFEKSRGLEDCFAFPIAAKAGITQAPIIGGIESNLVHPRGWGQPKKNLQRRLCPFQRRVQPNSLRLLRQKIRF